MLIRQNPAKKSTSVACPSQKKHLQNIGYYSHPLLLSFFTSNTQDIYNTTTINYNNSSQVASTSTSSFQSPFSISSTMFLFTTSIFNIPFLQKDNTNAILLAGIGCVLAFFLCVLGAVCATSHAFEFNCRHNQHSAAILPLLQVYVLLLYGIIIPYKIQSKMTDAVSTKEASSFFIASLFVGLASLASGVGMRSLLKKCNAIVSKLDLDHKRKTELQKRQQRRVSIAISVLWLIYYVGVALFPPFSGFAMRNLVKELRDQLDKGQKKNRSASKKHGQEFRFTTFNQYFIVCGTIGVAGFFFALRLVG